MQNPPENDYDFANQIIKLLESANTFNPALDSTISIEKQLFKFVYREEYDKEILFYQDEDIKECRELLEEVRTEKNRVADVFKEVNMDIDNLDGKLKSYVDDTKLMICSHFTPLARMLLEAHFEKFEPLKEEFKFEVGLKRKGGYVSYFESYAHCLSKLIEYKLHHFDTMTPEEKDIICRKIKIADAKTSTFNYHKEILNYNWIIDDLKTLKKKFIKDVWDSVLATPIDRLQSAHVTEPEMCKLIEIFKFCAPNFVFKRMQPPNTIVTQTELKLLRPVSLPLPLMFPTFPFVQPAYPSSFGALQLLNPNQYLNFLASNSLALNLISQFGGVPPTLQTFMEHTSLFPFADPPNHFPHQQPNQASNKKPLASNFSIDHLINSKQADPSNTTG